MSARARLLPLVAVAAGLAAGALAFGPLEGAPHVQDEVVYLFQAGGLAHLSLWSPAPDVPVAAVFSTIVGDRWYGAFPNGWPAVLALGVLAGVPSAVNPLLHALTTWRAGVLGGRIGDRTGGLASAVLVGFSPQMLVLAGSMMSHTLVALLVVVGAEALLRWRASPARGEALVLGLVVGLACLARPLCGAVMGLAATLGCLGRSPRTLWAAALPVAIAGLAQVGQNTILTGDPLLLPMNALAHAMAASTGVSPRCDALGFGPDRGCWAYGRPGHDLEDGLANTLVNLKAWGNLLYGSPFLLLVPIFAARERAARWALAFAGGIMAVYALYWYPGTCYGARFLHAAAPLLLLTSGVVLSRTRLGTLVVGGLLVAFVARLATVLPELRGYWGVDGRVFHLAETWSGPPAVVLVRVDEGAWRSSAPLTSAVAEVVVPALDEIVSGNTRYDQRVIFLVATPEHLAAARASGREVWGLTLGRSPGADVLYPPARP